jgi:hypothetical protein
MAHTRLFLAAALALGLALAAAPRAAEPQSEQSILLDTIRANRKAFVAVNLQLGADEAKSFWPLYDKYQAEMNGVQERFVAIIDDYTAHFADMPDDKAQKLVQDFLAAEADRVKIRQSYLPEFSKILPGRTVARFYQLENKMDAVVRYEIAKTIPVIEEKAAERATK